MTNSDEDDYEDAHIAEKVAVYFVFFCLVAVGLLGVLGYCLGWTANNTDDNLGNGGKDLEAAEEEAERLRLEGEE